MIRRSDATLTGDGRGGGGGERERTTAVFGMVDDVSVASLKRTVYPGTATTLTAAQSTHAVGAHERHERRRSCCTIRRRR